MSSPTQLRYAKRLRSGQNEALWTGVDRGLNTDAVNLAVHVAQPHLDALAVHQAQATAV